MSIPYILELYSPAIIDFTLRFTQLMPLKFYFVLYHPTLPYMERPMNHYALLLALMNQKNTNYSQVGMFGDYM